MTTKYIRIVIDSKGAKRNADDLNRSVRGIGDSAGSSIFTVNRLAAAIAGVISVQKVAQYADAWTSVQNQLRQTAETSQELVQVSDAIVEIAKNTRSELEGTAQLYSRFRLSIDDTVISNERLLGVVETINQQLALSGATASEAAGALRQLAQGIASGVLRGEEFNSVAEQAPGILRAVSKETGLAVGQLREFAAEGGITSDILIRALENYRDTSQEAFSKSEVTISQSLQVARTNLIQFIGAVDDATGASSGLASAIVDFSNSVGSPEFISNVIQAFNNARLIINAVSDSVGDLSNEIKLLKDVGGGSVEFLGGAFRDLLPNVRSFLEIISIEAITALDKVRIAKQTIARILAAPFSTDTIAEAFADFNKQIEISNQARRDGIEASLQERQTILETARSNAEAYAKDAAARKAARDAVSLGGGSPVIGGSSGKSKIDEDFSSREVDSARSVTRSLEQELATRRQIADIYRSNELSADASFYQQQLAQIQIKEAEEAAIAQSKRAEETAQREERLAATLENEKLTAESRAALKAEFDAQEKLAEEILQTELTTIREEGKKAREELDKAEFNARLANAGLLGDSLMTLGQGQSKKIFKIGQTLALAQAAVSLPAAVLESFKNGGGYPWGLVSAAAMAATGLKQIQQIRAAGAGLGGGGGGSVSVPSLSGGGAGNGPGIPTTASAQAVEQRRVFELRGVAGSDKITIDQFKELMEQDGATVVLSDAVSDAARRNVPGVNAR